jgi:hypothetical protein
MRISAVRFASFLMILPHLLISCAPARIAPVEGQFALVDQAKYKDEQAKALGFQLATNECKSKALSASAALEKTISGEKAGMENRLRAREQASSMYASSYTACMNARGYIQKQAPS